MFHSVLEKGVREVLKLAHKVAFKYQGFSKSSSICNLDNYQKFEDIC
jgi:hypothetical protein